MNYSEIKIKAEDLWASDEIPLEPKYGDIVRDALFESMQYRDFAPNNFHKHQRMLVSWFRRNGAYYNKRFLSYEINYDDVLNIKHITEQQARMTAQKTGMRNSRRIDSGSDTVASFKQDEAENHQNNNGTSENHSIETPTLKHSKVTDVLGEVVEHSDAGKTTDVNTTDAGNRHSKNAYGEVNTETTNGTTNTVNTNVHDKQHTLDKIGDTEETITNGKVTVTNTDKLGARKVSDNKAELVNSHTDGGSVDVTTADMGARHDEENGGQYSDTVTQNVQNSTVTTTNEAFTDSVTPANVTGVTATDVGARHSTESPAIKSTTNKNSDLPDVIGAGVDGNINGVQISTEALIAASDSHSDLTQDKTTSTKTIVAPETTEHGKQSSTVTTNIPNATTTTSRNVTKPSSKDSREYTDKTTVNHTQLNDSKDTVNQHTDIQSTDAVTDIHTNETVQDTPNTIASKEHSNEHNADGYTDSVTVDFSQTTPTTAKTLAKTDEAYTDAYKDVNTSIKTQDQEAINKRESVTNSHESEDISATQSKTDANGKNGSDNDSVGLNNGFGSNDNEDLKASEDFGTDSSESLTGQSLASRTYNVGVDSTRADLIKKYLSAVDNLTEEIVEELADQYYVKLWRF